MRKFPWPLYQPPLAAWILALIFAGSTLTHADRVELDLSGAWQYQKSTSSIYPPPSAWLSTTVPGYLSGPHYEHAWYRKSFNIPIAMTGHQLKLRFGGAKFDARVWLNGTFIGGYLNGYEPFALDATAAAHVGQANELVVAVTDWTATFSSPVDFSNLGSYENPRDHAKNVILTPIGGHYNLYGLWQGVKLVAVPEVFLDDVFVMPSLRGEPTLTARVILRNEGAAIHEVLLKNRVLDGSSTALQLPDQSLGLAPGETNQIEIARIWQGIGLSVRRWSPEDPYLYQLETTIEVDGTPQDRLMTRFGFRELWRENSELLLNGTPIHLLGCATWPPTTVLTRDQIRNVLLDVKAGNNVAIRFHTQPWDETWYEVADEVGLLVVEEGAIWCDAYSYRLADPLFWANYARHLTAAVRRDRNHPSIVVWSLENELLHVGGARAYAGTEAELAKLAGVVRAEDPTRLITYESDLDPGGAADVIGLHYPHEFPDYALWPNAAYWMDESISRDWAPGGQWKWRRDKPLYIGEFLWVPGTSARGFTILYGDDAYFNPAQYRNMAKAWTWRMQIEAYRSYGVNGMCPWTLFEDPAAGASPMNLNPDNNQLYQAQKAAYAPNAVFVQPYNTRFFAGSAGQRAFTVYNDTPRRDNFGLKWRASPLALWNNAAFSLEPAQKTAQSVTFTTPATPGPFQLEVRLDRGTTPISTNLLDFTSHPRNNLSLPAGTRLGLFDPGKNTAPILAAGGLRYTNVIALSNAPYDRLDILLIGRDALTNDSLIEVGPQSVASQWSSFTRLQGGWIILLEQTNYPRWFPGEVTLENVAANFAFPDPRHPVSTNLHAEDLRWWAGDHRTVAKAIRIPSSGNFFAPIRAGSSEGMEFAGLLELPMGRGGILCSQLLLQTKFNDEPMAAILWQRLFDYRAAPTSRPMTRSAGLIAESNSAAALRLDRLGLLAEPLPVSMTPLDPRLYPVIILAGASGAFWSQASANLAAFRDFADGGGKLLIHRPNAAFLMDARPGLFPGLAWENTRPAQLLRRDDPPLIAAFSNHDLAWVVQDGSWDRPEVLSSNIATRIYRPVFDLTNYTTINVANMPIHTSGAAIGGDWALYASGYVAQDIDVPQPGNYLFSVTAKGTPVAGVFPLMSLRLDGQTQDATFVTDTNWLNFTLSADLTAGAHQLAISFDNDAYNLPEDRNLYLRQIRYGPATQGRGIEPLTKPAAVAQIQQGTGLIVLDEISWESEELNRTKAGRLVSRLLTGLGATFESYSGVSIAGAEMRNVDVAAYSTNQGVAYLNSNGRIEIPVRFTSTTNYIFEVAASGTPATKVAPLLEVRLDGTTVKTISVTSLSFDRYLFNLRVKAGAHTVALAFVNDYYNLPEDRNVAVQRLLIAPEPPPRFAGIHRGVNESGTALIWEGVSGRGYAIEARSDLAMPPWQTLALVTNQGRRASWVDTNGDAGTGARGQQFYRIRVQ